jgi:hypothetical protein
MTNPLASIPAPTTADDDDGGQFIRDCTARYPDLTPAQRAGFDRKCPVEKADDWGTRTKAVNVLHDAERFARIIDEALGNPRGSLAYGAVRFRYLLDGTQALRAAIEVDQGAGGVVAPVTVAKAHEDALLARDVILERLNDFAEGDDIRAAEIAKAQGNTKDDEAILRSLKSLAKLAKDWMSSPDPIDQAMAQTALLDDTSLQATLDARSALSDARSATQAGGPKAPVRDSPETNRIEGRVLFEMHHAMTLFEGAHARDKLSPRLIPSTGTRHVLARNRKKPAPTPAEAPKPADPPAAVAPKPADPPAAVAPKPADPPAAEPPKPADPPAEPPKGG